MSGMNSEKLSQRSVQPGHDVSFRTSEENFGKALELILDPAEWEVSNKPKELRKIIAGRYGIEPETSIRNRRTGKEVYFEVKKQKGGGNAEERACKHHTVQFYREIHELLGYDYHPFVTIMCENLAEDVRYVLKHPFYFEEGQYFLWRDYNIESLRAFIHDLIERFGLESP